MASLSEFNWLGQQRVDIPHLRMLEAGVRGDLDALGYSLVGERPMIIQGFELLNATPGTIATLLTIKVAGSKLIHPLASESGSIFAVRSDRLNEVLDPQLNSRMVGSILPNSTSFIGIDLKRSSDSATADMVQFLDPTLNIESGQRVPLRRTLDYQWIITQTDFTYNRSVCPIAIVTTDIVNNIVGVVDARPLFGRLTPGGLVSSDVSPYGWPGGRDDSAPVSNPIAGDKSLRSVKDTIDAIETRLWELGGGAQWYSLTADRNVSIRLGATTFSSTGQSFEIVSGHLHWQGISFTFDNSTYPSIAVSDQLTSVAGLTDLANGECIYVDLNRSYSAPVSAQKGQLTTLGGSIRPGQRWVIASRVGSHYYAANQPWPIGGAFNIATTTVTGSVKTNIDFTATTPIAATIGQSGNSTGFVTGGGLSHNLDVGVAHGIPSSPGDIILGRGIAAGDANIILGTDQNYTTIIEAGAGSVAPYVVIRSSPGFDPLPTDTVLDLQYGSATLGGDGAWGLKTGLIAVPLPPENGQIRYFCRPTKVWAVGVVAVLFGDGAHWPKNGGGNLVHDTVGAFTTDGITGWSVGNRVLVNMYNCMYNGIYTVAVVGDGSTYTVLTRATDANSKNQFFNGLAVPVAQGATYGHKNMMLYCANNYNATAIDGSVYLSFRLTTSETLDMFCIMFADGSYTAIATSSVPYDGGNY